MWRMGQVIWLRLGSSPDVEEPTGDESSRHNGPPAPALDGTGTGKDEHHQQDEGDGRFHVSLPLARRIRRSSFASQRATPLFFSIAL